MVYIMVQIDKMLKIKVKMVKVLFILIIEVVVGVKN
jgi:hypothetical protein